MINDEVILKCAIAEAKYDGRSWNGLSKWDKQRYLDRMQLILETYENSLWRNDPENAKCGKSYLIEWGIGHYTEILTKSESYWWNDCLELYDKDIKRYREI